MKSVIRFERVNWTVSRNGVVLKDFGRQEPKGEICLKGVPAMTKVEEKGQKLRSCSLSPTLRVPKQHGAYEFARILYMYQRHSLATLC